ncbi:unnamed protein product [Caenorhabditis bovis]|uniref:C2H2-type domain-containing protein n=1 Tax=Caenorhabditis bovis TaxID=2654633 RepID=A0A8S1ETP6_9PELO|nr:unnamed protein product [Caenorhabditis bovis]
MQSSKESVKVEKCADSTTEDDDMSTEESSSKSGELKRPDLKGSFRCSICSKVFCHSSSLSRHRMQSHFKTYKCTICRKDISNSETLRSHMFNSHHVSRMYMCRCCNWAFPEKALLHIHLQSASDATRGSVINRTYHPCVSDPYSVVFNSQPVATSPMMVGSFQEAPATPPWLASLPKPIPTTIPLFACDTKCGSENERTSSESPECSTSSIKSEQSAFHQLKADSPIISPVQTVSPSSNSEISAISPKNECYDCQIYKTKLSISENKCKYLESRSNILQNEAIDSQTHVTSLEHTIHRQRLECQLLREHNELFQRKLLECQSLAVRFLQAGKIENPSDITAVLNHIVNATIITS